MTVGERIKYLREKKKISQEKMAFDICVSRQTISKWESGTASPDSSNITVLCDYFKVSADYLLNGIETEYKPKRDNTVVALNLVYISIGVIILVLGILFQTVPTLKDEVKVSSSSSFIEIPIGILLLVISCIIIIVFGIKLIREIKKIG